MCGASVFGMFLGRLTAGMLAGAAAAAASLFAGGSLALALGIYSVVGVTAVLFTAYLGFRQSERRERDGRTSSDPLDRSE